MTVVNVRFHETRKCPIGSLAWHATLGLVDVLEARGWERVVQVGRPGAGQPDVVSIDVRELELVDADPDFGVAFAYALDEQTFRDEIEADQSELAADRAWEAAALGYRRVDSRRD